MARLEGWQKVRNWWVYVAQPVIRDCRAWARGAQAADKQSPYSLVPEVALPAQVADEQAPGGDGIAGPLATTFDQFGRIGLVEWEARLLVSWLGGDSERLSEVIQWVFRAHKRLELLDFPNYGGEPSVAMLRDVHPGAVESLERLLRQLVAIPDLSVEQTYALLRQRLPGIELPRCRSQSDLGELIAVARNLNGWCAEAGTLPCGCSALSIDKL